MSSYARTGSARSVVLAINKYHPNTRDPRVVKRIKAVLAWCDALRLNNKLVCISKAELRSVFSNTSQGLGLWMYSNLLVQHGTYAPGIRSYSYALRADGYEKLHELIGAEVLTPIQIAHQKYGQVAEGKQKVEYTDTGGRLYSGVQNLPRALRKQVFAGWWDYDIEACAPTLLTQYIGRHSCLRPAMQLERVQKLIHEKNWVREHVASIAGVSVAIAKKIIAALFFGARLSPYHDTAIFAALNFDKEAYVRLRADSFIIGLRSELKLMWKRAFAIYQAEQPGAYGKASRVSPNAKDRMAIYITLERQAIDILMCLRSNGCPIVIMHDGFMSQERQSVEQLEELIKSTTGYKIKIKEEKIVPAVDG